MSENQWKPITRTVAYKLEQEGRVVVVAPEDEHVRIKIQNLDDVWAQTVCIPRHVLETMLVEIRRGGL